jgi:hypothetical protein
MLDYQAVPGVAEPLRVAPVFTFAFALAAVGVAITYAEAAFAGWPDTHRERTEFKLSICMFVGFAIVFPLLLTCSLAIHLRTGTWIWRSLPSVRAATIGLAFYAPSTLAAHVAPEPGWLTVAMWIYFLGVPVAVARLLLVRERPLMHG